MDMEEMEAEIRMLKLRIERNERIKCHSVVARLKRELAQLENELKEFGYGTERSRTEDYSL